MRSSFPRAAEGCRAASRPRSGHCGLASGLRRGGRDGRAALRGARGGAPTEIAYRASFVDGIGAPRVYPEMFNLARRLVDGALVSSVAEVAQAVRLIAERTRTIAERAGAASVAAALAGRAGTGKIVCVVSGGNIDASKLATILAGGTP